MCDSLLGTLLEIKGKSKDRLSCREDLEDMGIRPALHKQPRDEKLFYLLQACYTLSRVEKKHLCECLWAIKLTSRYSSNIRKCVQMKDLKIVGLKSHDSHLLMQ